MTTPTNNEADRADKAKGTGPFYLVALVCSGLSLDTAARYFHGPMGINGLPIHGVSAELAAICGVGELTLIACGYAMRHNVRRPEGKPGVAQLVALAMCSAATFMAFALDGPVAGAVRAFFGPILALITLHLALGIEVKVRSGASTGVWARIGAEFRERFLSRIGLGDDGRLAAERTRDRARERAARLATATGWVPWKEARLVRAVRASGATLDPVQRRRLVEQVGVLRNIGDLQTIKYPSPWTDDATAATVDAQSTTETATGHATDGATAALQPSSALMSIDPQLAAIVRNGRNGSARNGETRNGRNAQVSTPVAPSATDRSDAAFMAIVGPLVARSLDATGTAPSQRSVRNAIEAKVQPAPGFKKVGELIERATAAHRERSERAAADDAERSDDPDRDRINGRKLEPIGAAS